MDASAVASCAFGLVPLAVSHASGMPSPSVSVLALPLHHDQLVGAPIGRDVSYVMSAPLEPQLATSSTM